MTFQLTAKVLMTALVVSSSVGLTNNFALSQTQQPAPTSAATVFQCVSAGSGYATVAKRGERTTPPLITWNSKEFGSQYTPKQRCNIVSKRLTKAVAANGGKLKNLLLTYGVVNGKSVICYVKDTGRACNDRNILMTLRSQDRGQEAKILDSLVSFSVKGTGNSINQSSQLPRYANFGERVEQSFEAQGVVNSPNPTQSENQKPIPSQPANTSIQQPTSSQDSSI
ncbi:COP23 domain-containing protein [Scytonema sp. NUACC26]|uniref:COP23 domain-containing protein n=1 Tax=Scytonema sp. NUACC26 TaxID=3140176 RepID=UPI0034DBD2A3